MNKEKETGMKSMQSRHKCGCGEEEQISRKDRKSDSSDTEHKCYGQGPGPGAIKRRRAHF